MYHARELETLSPQRFAISIDVGGTFTDFVLFELGSGASVVFHKVLTTPREPARAVLAGWSDLLAMSGVAAAQVDYVVHSTTLVTNAIVERRGARTALIASRGFRDVLEIGIEQIYDIYDLFAPYPTPLVPRQLRREVGERLTRDGTVVEPLDGAEVRTLVEELAADGVESIAVSLLHSYRNPDHERRIGALIREAHPGLTVSLSSQVAPVIGEYERTSTVVADAYVKPLLNRYLSDLTRDLQALGFARQLYMMLSSGGIATAEAAMEFPIRLLESGPAAGAFAASFYGGLRRRRDVLSFDMGGTTAKACLIEEGVPGVSHMLEADRVHRFAPGSGLPIVTPTIDLIETGAGGGSIAKIGKLGLLNVGPESAGSDPGPASYGLGGERPTVTDANLVLGYLDPAYFLGGRMALDRERAERAIDADVARPLGLGVVAAAWGIHEVVNENMARAARTHVIERNRDPRDLALVAFGGAGPAHAVAVARILGIDEVIVPFGAGVASAIGALTAPLALPFVRSYITLLRGCDWDEVGRLFAEMQDEARRALATSDQPDPVFRTRIAAEMRFAGQYHEIRVDLPPVAELGTAAVAEIEARFRERYSATYGRALSGLQVEALNWHLVAEAARPALRVAAQPVEEASPELGRKGERAVYFPLPTPGYQPCPVYDRYLLASGFALAGPCIFEEPEATIVVPPGYAVAVDAYRNVVIRRERDGGQR
jgi:N-methylhydantoinase A/oxoprolinase/acetone carboxylase beta subunit